MRLLVRQISHGAPTENKSDAVWLLGFIHCLVSAAVSCWCVRIARPNSARSREEERNPEVLKFGCTSCAVSKTALFHIKKGTSPSKADSELVLTLSHCQYRETTQIPLLV